jgi:hypothetical protein
MWPYRCYKGLKYICDYGTNNYNPSKYRTTLTTIYQKKQSLKQLWLEAPEGQKAARQRKHNDWKKERRLL